MGSQKNHMDVMARIDALEKQVYDLKKQLGSDTDYRFENELHDIGELKVETLGTGGWFVCNGDVVLNPNKPMILAEAYEIAELVNSKIENEIPFDCPDMIDAMRKRDAARVRHNANAEGQDAKDAA